jgi:cell division septation protein DedD
MASIPPEDLEYNDGLGDLLREKEKREFSWIKTIVVMVLLIGLVFLGLMLTFMIGKSLLDRGSKGQVPESVMKNLEKMEKDMENGFEPKDASGNFKAATANTASPAKPATPAPAVQPKPIVAQPAPVKPAPVKPAPAPAAPAKPIEHKPQPKPAPKAAPAPKPVEKKIAKPAAKPVSSADTSFKVLLGKFPTQDEARSLQKRLKAQNIDAFVWFSAQDSSYVVQIGAFRNGREAEAAVTRFREKGYNPFILQK